MSDAVQSFVSRIKQATGLQPEAIPDGQLDDLLGGSIVAASPHGRLVLHDPIGRDGDGTTYYERAVIVGRGSQLPPADPAATGVIAYEAPYPWA